MKTNFPTCQRGNALWFILIAIVLLGALTMLLTRSGNDSSQTGDVEQMRIKASQIMRWARGLEDAIIQMRANGLSETNISFENSVTATSYTPMTPCPKPEQACQVFGAGGGQTYLNPPSGVNDGQEWVFTGFHNIGSAEDPIGTTAQKTGNDLIVYLRGINSALCIQINKDLNIGTPGTIPVEAEETRDDPFVGEFIDKFSIIDGDDTLHELNGHHTGCYYDSSGQNNIFYYVLIAR